MSKPVRRLRPALVLIALAPLTLGLQGCLAMAVGGAVVGVTGAVVGTAGSVAVGTARVGGHVVASGVRAATGSGRDRDEEQRGRRDRRDRNDAHEEGDENRR